MINSDLPAMSESAPGPVLNSIHKSSERLSRSLTIETSPRSLASDVEAGTRILHPDGTVSTLDHIPEGTIKLNRFLSGT